MPPDWDLLVSGDRLVSTLFELAMDPTCPARRFALHCLYIYAADGIRTNFRAHPKRRFRKLVEQAERDGDELMRSGRTTAGCCWPGRSSSSTGTGARAAWSARTAASAETASPYRGERAATAARAITRPARTAATRTGRDPPWVPARTSVTGQSCLPFRLGSAPVAAVVARLGEPPVR